MTANTQVSDAVQYAGFWRRFIAYVIDYLILGLAIFALFALLSLVFPNLPQVITPELPFRLLTTDRTLEEKSSENMSDGDKVTETEKIVERTVFGKWTYLYKVTETTTAHKDSALSPSTSSIWQQVDPETKLDVNSTDLGTIAFFAAFVYFAVMESSRRQATFGKMAMGVMVTDRNGARLNFPRAFLRNIAKLVSMITLGIGFLMAGWTQKKQALHDMIAEALVVSRW